MRDYILTLLVAAAVTYMLTPLVRRVAIRFGAMHAPRERDMHTVPVPRMGGVAMYAGLAVGLLVADQIPQLRSSIASTGMVPGLLLAGGLLVAIGVVDDRWGMPALAKLAGQVAAGAILVATGTQLDWLPLPGSRTFAPTPDQSTLLTILVVVATINAVNFIDGLDGLAAGIVAIAAVSFLIYYYTMTKVVGVSALAAPALASAILTGVCLGFLPHNFHPARIFMGDTGAMLLGLVLAYAPISSITSLDPAVLLSKVNRYPEVMPLLLPVVILVIPYGDMLLAVIRRTRAGLSPAAADSKHLHHRLVAIGHSQRASVLVMYLWAALFSGSIVWFSLEKTSQPGRAKHYGEPVLVFVVITAVAILALVLMSMPWLRNRDRPGKLAAEAAAVEVTAAGAARASAAAQAGAVEAAAAQVASAGALAGVAAPSAGGHSDGQGGQPAARRQLISVTAPPLPAPVVTAPLPVDTGVTSRGRHGGQGGSHRSPAGGNRTSDSRTSDNGHSDHGHSDNGTSGSGSSGGDGRGPAVTNAVTDRASWSAARLIGSAGPLTGSRGEAEDSRDALTSDAAPRPQGPEESSRPARSVVGMVPPAVVSESHPGTGAGGFNAGPSGGEKSDQVPWRGRSRTGSRPPGVASGGLPEPLPRRPRPDNPARRARPGEAAQPAQPEQPPQ